MGHFSMIESLNDRRGGGNTTISGQELACWERLICFKLGIMDVWHSQSFMKMALSLAFSHSDRRNEGVNVSRLDRFYLSNYFHEKGGLIGIMPGTTFSDHAPVCINILEERSVSSLHM